MKLVWIIGNGVAIVSAIVCMACLYHVLRENRDSRFPPLSVAIIGITAVVTTLQFVHPPVLAAFRRDAHGLASGELWRVFSPLFVQPYGWIQCFSNAFLTLTFMPLAERLFRNGLLTIYFVSGIAGTLLCYLWLPDLGGGSSTAAFGVIGALFAYVWRYRSRLHSAIFAAASIGLLAGIVMAAVRDGHGAGLLVGAFIGSVLRPKLEPSTDPARERAPVTV